MYGAGGSARPGQGKVEGLSFEDVVMQFVFGADWSSSKSHVSDLSSSADLRSRLGLGLRELYRDPAQEPVPEFLAELIRALEEREQRTNR